MPFQITCECGQLLEVPENQTEASVRCPHCDRQLAVSVPNAPAPPAISQVAAPSEEADELPIVVDTTVDVGRVVKRDREWQTVQLLAAAIGFIALVNAIPVALAVVASQDGSDSLERWTYGVLWISLVQLVYAVYLIQLSDWSAVWVVSLVTLLITTVYACLMGLRLLAAHGNRFMQYLELDGNRYSSGQEAGWCFIMMLLTGTLSYFAGRFASRWSQAARDAHAT